MCLPTKTSLCHTYGHSHCQTENRREEFRLFHLYLNVPAFDNASACREPRVCACSRSMVEGNESVLEAGHSKETPCPSHLNGDYIMKLHFCEPRARRLTAWFAGTQVAQNVWPSCSQHWPSRRKDCQRRPTRGQPSPAFFCVPNFRLGGANYCLL